LNIIADMLKILKKKKQEKDYFPIFLTKPGKAINKCSKPEAGYKKSNLPVAL